MAEKIVQTAGRDALGEFAPDLHISMTMFFSEKTGIIRTLILRPEVSSQWLL